MHRRTFIFNASGLVLTAWLPSTFAKAAVSKNNLDRIAMGTLVFRDRFKQTQKGVLANELTLMDIPQHHRDTFGIKKLEFWSEHFSRMTLLT